MHLIYYIWEYRVRIFSRQLQSESLTCEEEHGWDSTEAVRDEPCKDHPDQEAEEGRLLGQLPEEF